MATAATEIERLVREVLAELAAGPAINSPLPPGEGQGEGAVAPTSSQRAAAASLPSVPVPICPDSELTVAARVVTMTELLGRLDGLRRLVVLPDAVVTPAVHDELRRRGVALVRSAPARRAAGGELRLVLVASGKGFELAPWIDGLRREGVTVEHQAIDCLIAATDRLAAEVTKPGTLGVLLTPHWAAGLCLANRRPGVRAVVGLDLPAAAAATAAVGANLLVIDPDAGAMYQGKQMLAEFCRGGVRPCPPVFQKQLG